MEVKAHHYANEDNSSIRREIKNTEKSRIETQVIKKQFWRKRKKFRSHHEHLSEFS